MAALVLHINREALHHGAEVALLLDLYHRHPNGGTPMKPSTSRSSSTAPIPTCWPASGPPLRTNEVEDHPTT